MSNNIDYGSTVSAEDARVFSNDVAAGYDTEEEREITPLGNDLWTYRKEGTINGIAVVDADKDLPITKESYLRTAFELKSIPKSFIFWMAPDEEKAIADYNELLAKVYRGEVMIVDEIKQYDATKGKFMVWIRYNEVKYALHERFNSLREELSYD